MPPCLSPGAVAGSQMYSISICCVRSHLRKIKGNSLKGCLTFQRNGKSYRSELCSELHMYIFLVVLFNM